MTRAWPSITALLIVVLVVVVGCAQAPSNEPRPSATDLFLCLDGNGNGYLESGELQHTAACEPGNAFADRDLPTSGKRRAEAMITEMDIDGDDRISGREFDAWYNR